NSPTVADQLATFESILIDRAAAQGHAMAEVRHAPQNANGLSAGYSNQRAEERPHATVPDEQPTPRTDSHESSTSDQPSGVERPPSEPQVALQQPPPLPDPPTADTVAAPDGSPGTGHGTG